MLLLGFYVKINIVIGCEIEGKLFTIFENGTTTATSILLVSAKYFPQHDAVGPFFTVCFQSDVWPKIW